MFTHTDTTLHFEKCADNIIDVKWARSDSSAMIDLLVFYFSMHLMISYIYVSKRVHKKTHVAMIFVICSIK